MTGREPVTKRTGAGIDPPGDTTTTRSASLPAEHSAGILLREWRQRALLTQEELAARAGLDARTVRRLEADDLRRPRTSTLRLVADALGLDEEERAQLRAALPGGTARRDVPADGAPAQAVAVPRQLPADSADFTGRTDEVDYLLAGRGAGAAVWTIDGMAGIGKTALAIRVAHAAASAYPDGQLFVDLHGASARPLDPVEALGRLLRSLGVPGEVVPPGVDARSALLRSEVARRRVLVLLDDAAAEHQVAPLLPGAGDSLVVVTSRRHLAGLDRSRTVSLDVLPAADAARLFVNSAESPGLLEEAPHAVAETVELCGRVPLAIRVAAARLRSRPAWGLADLNARLGAEDRLDELVAGGRGMAAALDTSVEQLAELHRCAYDLLGLMTGPDIGLGAASALIDLDPRRARVVLDELVECNLLDEVAPDRFGMHALVREHARAGMSNRTAESSAAVLRLLDYYVATTAAVVRVAYSQVPTPSEGRFDDLGAPTHRESARRWLDTELDNLLTAAASSREEGLDQHVVDLSALLDRHLTATARHHRALFLHQAAVDCARRTDDRAAEALALTRLAFVRLRLESPDQSATLYRRGLGVARDAGSGRAVATALVGLANAHRMRDDFAGARSLLTEALAIARTPDGASVLPDVLVHLGHVHRQYGNVEAAEECLTESIRLTRRDGDTGLEMYALVGLGWIRYATGGDDEAGRAFSRVLELAREDGHVAGQAAAELGLGYVLLRRGDPVGATVHFQQLEKLADRLGSRNSQFEAVLGCAMAYRDADPARTVDLGGQALAIARELEQRVDVARAHDIVAGALVQLGDRSGAAEHWDHALELLADLGVDAVEDGDISVASIAQQRALLDDPRPGAAGGEART